MSPDADVTLHFGRTAGDDSSTVARQLGASLNIRVTHLDAVYYCLHHPAALLPDYRVICECRKPRPGMLLKLVERTGSERSSTWMIGDSLVDVEAGQAAGVLVYLLMALILLWRPDGLFRAA